MEQLRQEKQEIDQQLRAIQGTNMGSMQNFQSSRRSDRAYSNDYDSRSSRGGSSRGGPRGSGRGSRGDGRNSMSGNPRYSNRRDHRGGDDTEEEYHTRGGHFTNSGKYQGNRPGGGRGGGGPNKGKGNDYRRGNLGGSKDDHQHRDTSSLDRGKKKFKIINFFINMK